MIPANRKLNFFTLLLREWLLVNLEKNSQHGEEWTTIFATATWWIWKWRNKRRFGDPDFQPYRPWSFIIDRAKEITEAVMEPPNTHTGTGGSRRQETFIYWHPPPEGWINLNVDGASKGNPRAAGGGGLF